MYAKIIGLVLVSLLIPPSQQAKPKQVLPLKQQQPAKQRLIVPLQAKPREFVNPEAVGVGKDCPFPCVKKRIAFQCSCCGLKMWTHVLYPHLPHCPKDNCLMLEID